MNRSRVHAVLGGAAMVLIGLSALSKLHDLPDFLRTVHTWRMIPTWATGLVAVLVPSLELGLAGVYFAIPVHSNLAARWALAMLAAWTGAYLCETVLWGPPQCGCFGRLKEWVVARDDAPLIVARNTSLGALLLVGQWRRAGLAQRPRARPERSGFTLIETLMVITLLGLLAALVTPSLSAVVLKGKSARALADLRTHAQTVAAYSIDFKDSFPCILDPRYTHTVVVMPDSNERVLLAYFQQRFFWWLGLADGYYNGSRMSPSFFSPRRYGSGLGEPYYYSVSGLARPEYWNNETRMPKGQIGPMKLSDTVFPERKGVFVSWETTGVSGRSRRRYVLPEVAFCSGAARVVNGEDLFSPVPQGEGPRGWPYSFDPNGDPITHTLNGVRGVDVR